MFLSFLGPLSSFAYIRLCCASFINRSAKFCKLLGRRAVLPLLITFFVAHFIIAP